MIDLTPIIIAVLTFAMTLITSMLVPYIRSKTTAQQQDTIKMWVDIAVMAAEQLYKGSGRGAEKKAYVTAFLESKGFKIDFDAIDALIEAAVFELPKADTISSTAIGFEMQGGI